MTPAGTTWLVSLLGLPVGLAVYFGLLVVLARRFGYRWSDLEPYASWLYVPFALAAAAGFLVVTDLRVPLRTHPAQILLVPVGLSLYVASTVIWERYSGGRVRRGAESTALLLPALLAPLPEEILFRVGLSPAIGTVGEPGYVAVSAAAFGVYHLVFGRRELLFKSALGLVLAVTYLWAGSVVAPIMAHLGYNAGYVLVAGVGVVPGRG